MSGRRLTLAVFASDKGPGDVERASIMSQAGSFFARKGARLVCLGEDFALPVPLITSARAAGGEVVIVADPGFDFPSALSALTIEHLPTVEERLRRVAALADLFVALPGSLGSAKSLFESWVRGGDGAARRPVVFYDRNGAFRVLRGFAADVVSNSVRHHDRYVQFADSIEDMWGKITWLVEQGATRAAS
jgi:predicted Rossmann-fold nucleotide-binding protein